MSSNDQRLAWQYFNRVYAAQIVHLDTKKGKVDVIFLDGLQTKRENLELPMTMSMRGQNSSWQRFMPQVRTVTVGGESAETKSNDSTSVKHIVGDLVLVGFGPQDQAYIVGYASMPGLYEAFLKEKVDNPSRVPTGDLHDLRPGEWDSRSSGGAYMHGDADGNLLLSAGPRSQIRFIKSRKEARGETGLWDHASTGSFHRFGDVKRKLPGQVTESDKSALDPTAPKERWTHVEIPVLGVASTLVADEQFGAVRDEFGVPYTSTQLAPLRFRKKIWVPGSTQAVAVSAFSHEIDTLGNEAITHGLGATSVSESGTTAQKSIDFLTFSANGTAHAELTSDAIAKIDAPVVTLGNEALALPNSAMHGTAYVLTNLAFVWPQMIAALTSLSPVIQALASDNHHTNPSVDPVAAAVEAFTVASTALIAAYTQMTTQATTPGPTGFLSTKVFVE